MLSFLTSLSLWILDLQMFPIFDIANDYLAAVDVRKSWGANFAKENPFCGVVSWALTIGSIFAGSLIASFLTGQQVLAALSDIPLLLLATFVWLAVSYSPYDVVYRFGEAFPVQVIVHTLKEIYRAKKVRSAVYLMFHFHPSAWMITKIAIGVIRGNGAGVVKQFWQIIRKTLSRNSDRNVETSLSTKSCFLASLIYLIQLNTGFIPLSLELIHLGIVCFFIVVKMSTLPFSIYLNKLARNCSKENINMTLKRVTKQKAEKKIN